MNNIIYPSGLRNYKMVDKEIVTRIAGKIRAIRLKQGLTIQQLAERADVSKGLLSKIENSRTIPSLPVFVQILRSLDISFMDFFADMGLGDQKKYILIRKDEAAATDTEGTIGDDANMVSIKPSSTIEMSLLTLTPHAGRDPQILRGYRFAHLISGMLEYHTENEVIALRNGDSIYFDGSIRHHLSNPCSDTDAQVFLIAFRC